LVEFFLLFSLWISFDRIKGEANMAVITISRQFGSGGDEIASRLCSGLGYRLFNKLMVEDAARQAGLLESSVVDLSEDNYPVRTFFDRLFGTMATGALVGFGGAEGVYLLESAERMTLDEKSSFDLVKKAVVGACDLGNLIVVGRGGQILLKEDPCCLHVRIEAPLDLRIQRVKEQLASSKVQRGEGHDLRREAQELIERRDRASADYIRTFFHLAWDAPNLYHVVINTGKLSLDQSVELISYMVHQFQPAAQAA
jgi:cytidylate kinase